MQEGECLSHPLKFTISPLNDGFKLRDFNSVLHIGPLKKPTLNFIPSDDLDLQDVSSIVDRVDLFRLTL